MNKSAITSLVFLIIWNQAQSRKSYTDISQICNEITDGKQPLFTDIIRKKIFTWDPVSAFNKGIFLGEGSFGQVRRIMYPIKNNELKELALKKLTITDETDMRMFLIEIGALEEMNQSNYSPRLYGCSYKKKQAIVNNYGFGYYAKPSYYLNQDSTFEIYVLQEKLFSDLDSDTFTRKIENLKVKEMLELWIQLFKGIRDLWKYGYAHNDIKPANLMTNINNDRIFLIDYGLGSPNDQKAISGGSRIIMSPAKYANYQQVQPKDDFYSAAISILILESDLKYSIFKVDCIGRNYQAMANPNLYDRKMQIKLAEHSAKVMKTNGYGSYQSSSESKETINFTTLITNMILYDKFSYKTLEVVDIMNRLIEKEQQIITDKIQNNNVINIFESRKNIEPAKIHENIQKVQKAMFDEEIIEKKNLNIYNLNKGKQIIKIEQQRIKIIAEPNEKPNEMKKTPYDITDEQIQEIEMEIQRNKKEAEMIIQNRLNEEVAREIDGPMIKPIKPIIELVEQKPQPVERWRVIYDELMIDVNKQYHDKKNEIESLKPSNLVNQLDHLYLLLENEEKIRESIAKNMASEEARAAQNNNNMNNELRALPAYVQRGNTQRMIPGYKKSSLQINRRLEEGSKLIVV